MKFDDIKVVLAFVKKGYHMIKFDLTSAYHFIDIYPPHTTYLGFAWPNDSGEMCYYKFLVLPFGPFQAIVIFLACRERQASIVLERYFRFQVSLLSFYACERDFRVSGGSDIIT